MKKAVLTLIVATCCLYSFAQSIVQEEWVAYYSSQDSIFNAATAIDVNGFVFVTGYVFNINTKADFTTIKYDPQGNIVWAKEYNNSPIDDKDKANAIALDASGNVYVTGVSNGIVGGNEDYVTIKYSSNGTQLWAVRYDNGGGDIPLDIKIGLSGDVYITGWSVGTSDFDYTTIKYDSNGVQQWVVRYDNGGDDRANAMEIDGNGIYVTGSSISGGTNFDIATVKYNFNGVQQWAVRYDGPANSYDAANAIALDGGNIFITGSSTGIGTNRDYITIKYDVNGNQQWLANYDESGLPDNARSIAIDNNSGDVIITGGVRTNVSGDDFATVKYDNNGSQIWIQKHNGSGNWHDQAVKVAIDINGDIYIAGRSYNGTNFDYTTIKYSSNGIELWTQIFNGIANGNENPADIAVDDSLNVYVTGQSFNGTNLDFATIKYSQTIVQPLTVTALITDENCEAAGEGSIDLTVTGGILPYTFQWSNGATTEDISGLTTGNYIVIVKDSIGTTIIETIVINDPPPDPKDPPSCSEVFISEYVEGTGHNKAIELYNPSSNDTIALNMYFLRVYMNGAPTPLIQQLVGVLMPRQTFVIAHPNADAAILAVACQTSNKLTFDGDDPVQLVKVLNDITIDIDSIEGIGGNPHAIFDTLDLDTLDNVGIPGVWPGNQGYPVGSGTTKNSTLIRKAGVTTGKEDWACGQKQWDVNGVDDASGLGSHENKCVPVEAGADDIVLVSFKDPFITGAEVDAFMQRNDLILKHKPFDDLPKGGDFSWTYIFRLGTAKCNIDPISAVSIIRVNEGAIVNHVQTNNRNYSFDQCFTVVNEMGLDTTAPNRMWHIENSGDVVIDTLSGTIDADADICDCWDAGYTGNGIRVAVIDGQGYDLIHEDVLGLPRTYIRPIYDCFLDTPLTGWTTWIWENNAHAMMTSGLIAGARANNNKGIAGVAKDAKIIPILTRFNTSEEIAIGIQAALRPEYNADVINMSFSTTDYDTTVHDEIVLASKFGRPNPLNPTEFFGCVMVASAGNAGDSLNPRYPAAYPEVIGVGGSNPDDFRADTSDGWPVSLWGGKVGSNYGPFYDVVAPATAMTSLDFMDTLGFDTSPGSNYFTASGTSFSAPVVSGIAAILLEKNPTLTWQEVRQAIIDGAEKVRDTIYDYNFDPLDPGRSFEMQYGRVSCINSLDSIEEFISGIEAANTNELFSDINVYYGSDDELIIVYDLNDEKDDVLMKVYDMLGRELKAQTLPVNQNRAVLSIREFTKGIYVLGFYTKQGDNVKSHKFVRH